ncbi:MAG: glutamine-hydrolyzing carbamoyl-phosphate synthase small subunit [Candidatus Omnitrophica bacterium]|nr:glutamine-hydrolyzing carbamoyl-phosphate synthase small subunit [Candidatus Omnitrophota bacterium]
MKAVLLLEDGLCVEGAAFGAEVETIGEVVFNTAMSGYQEILTDPSYRGQIVCMTYPLIGNYGITAHDKESGCVQVEGFIVKERSRIVSNWQAQQGLDEYLKEHKVVGIENIDTRMITKRLREKGAMKGVIATGEYKLKRLKEKLKASPSIIGRDLVKTVTCTEMYEWTEGLEYRGASEVSEKTKTVVVIDCGVKFSILRNLKEQFNRVIVAPARISFPELITLKPDAVVISNGPGDPEPVRYVISLAREIIEKLRRKELSVGLMGICLGHQIIGLAFGGRAEKLKFGHHGGNHPVKDHATGQIDITSQNHNFIVPEYTLPQDELVPTHVNLYDRTLEGLRHKTLPIVSVQFHPEAGPGPFDARYIFEKFKKMVDSLG